MKIIKIYQVNKLLDDNLSHSIWNLFLLQDVK